ncbi:unnamed protein product [Brugia timori]|uniref:Uncharacterized protein n=1 Tax=Brugia timori TaxID=42155 RepID=A0A0R3RAR7_9BILA|nr:unnamed protein product [Brugia timori]
MLLMAYSELKPSQSVDDFLCQQLAKHYCLLVLRLQIPCRRCLMSAYFSIRL